MTDHRDPFYTPFGKPAPPRQSQPREELWAFRQQDTMWSCVLRRHGTWGCEAQILSNGHLSIARMFPTQAQCEAWAAGERRDIEAGVFDG